MPDDDVPIIEKRDRPAPDAPKQRLLWHSNAPHIPTGYGQQTALWALKLSAKYAVGISSFFGVEGNVLPWNGMPVFPNIGTDYGDETILQHAQRWFDDVRGGVVWTLMDAWALNPAIWAKVNLASWCPIDHEPLGKPWRRFFDVTGGVPVAMSRFGQRVLETGGQKDVHYVPHAIDAATLTPRDRQESRDAIGLPKSAFIVGMVAANKGHTPSRKCFAESFQAFKAFADRHDDAMLYIHAEASGRFGRFGGVNLIDLAEAVGLNTDRIILPDQYRMLHLPYPPEHMAALYSALDVLLMPSMGEGFGIPAVEAQACGTPVIATDFSAQPELVGAGWLVKPATDRFYISIMQAWQVLPDVEDTLAALESCYGLPTGRYLEYRDKARSFAEPFHIDHVYETHMRPVLDDIFDRYGEPPAKATLEGVAA